MGSDRAVRRGTERGETLVEVMLAVAIIGIVAVTGVAGLTTATKVGADNRMSARSETVLRSAAEQLQNPDFAYIPRAGCPGQSAYSLPEAIDQEAGYELSVASVAFWGGASDTPSTSVGASFDGTCPPDDSGDLGLQQIVLEVTEPGGRTDSLTVMKRRP